LYILIKGVFIDSFAFGGRATIINCLGGEEEQACNVCGILYAQADQGKRAQFGG